MITQYFYEPDTGRLSTVTDPAGINTKTFYDDLSRRMFVVENHQGTYDPTSGIGTVTAGENRTTGWVYNGLGQVKTLTAYNSGSPTNQVTEYEYATAPTDNYDASLVTLTKYPDGSTTGPLNVTMTYNVDGSLATRKDQREVEIHYSYDRARRLEVQLVDDFGTSGIVDQTVQSITRKYDIQGRVIKITSHGNPTADPDNTTDIENQIQYTYGTHGKVTKTEQSHNGAVTTGTPAVQYAYDGSVTSNVYDDGLRLQTVTYPEGRVIFYGHLSQGTSTNIFDRLHRVFRIRQNNSSGTILTEYAYNGTGRWVHSDYTLADVWSNLHSNNSNGIYEGLDRFGRQLYQRWYKLSSPTAYLDEWDYKYDFAGNRLTRDLDSGVVSGAPTDHDQKFTYDGLHRLKTYDEGQLSGTSISNKRLAQQWTLDQLGNWFEFKQDNNGNGTWNLDQARQHNTVNELIRINSSATHLAHDKSGNMTKMPQSDNWSAHFDLKYDAWNRLVRVFESGDNYIIVIAKYEYDGLGRRIQKTADGDTYDYFYNDDWHVLEERKNGNTNPLAQYVWHPYYIDGLAVRYYDADTDGNLSENNDGRHWYCQDAKFNVTAVVNDSATVLERYHYTPYGEVTVLDADFSDDTNGLSDIGNNYLYTGRERDPETGLQINRWRYYLAHVGRFGRRDPGGSVGGPVFERLYQISTPTRFTNGRNSDEYVTESGRDWFAASAVAKQIYGIGWSNPVFDSGYVDGFNLYAGYYVMWGGTDPYGLGFWGDYWYYLRNPDEMDDDLETAQDVCIEVSITCAATATGTLGASHLSRFRHLRILNQNRYFRIGPGKWPGGKRCQRIAIGGGKDRIHIPITRPK